MAIPSGYTALDFVGFTDKGPYANNVTYVINDLVHYGGDIWKCKIDNTIGITPAVGANWEQWIGASANLVERIIAPLEQNPATIAYGVGRQIIWDDWLWEVITPIAVGDTLVDYAVDPTNANIKKSDPVETQLLAIKNGLGTAASKNVPASGNASTTQVVMGNDTRLTDARNAADVSAWAKASTKPTYKGNEIKTKVAQTGTAQSSVTSTIGANTTMDNAVGTLLDNDVTLSSEIQALANKAYQTDDTAETDIADGDYFPFYDSSATAKKKSLWSNIKNVLAKTFAQKTELALQQRTGSKNSGPDIVKGSYFYKDGELCRARRLIATNSDFTEGTNFTKVSDGGMNEIAIVESSVTFNSSMVTDTSINTLIKMGRVVVVNLSVNFNIPSGNNQNIGTLPNAFIPGRSVIATGINRVDKEFVNMELLSNGTIRVSSPAAHSGGSYFTYNFAYIIE